MTALPLLLKKLDELSFNAYKFLRSDEEIYYLREYTAKKEVGFSPTNQLIFHYKKKENSQEKALKEIASQFRHTIFHTEGLAERMKKATLVPIPPSGIKSNETYDDRNLRMLHQIMPNGDIRELILQKESRKPLHSSNHRNPANLMGNYLLNQETKHSDVHEIWLFDDVLTQGTHFRAAHDFLKKFFPRAAIVGFFIARSVYP